MAEALEIGGSFKNYRIVSKIGVGGMGEVFLAEDTELGRQVALKVLLSEVAGDEERVKRFVQEAKAASALNHPNILTVYEIGNFEGSRYIATELIKGGTLRDRLCGEPMTLREVLDVAMQVAAALNAAHNAGIVHRDIKPENIMLRDDGIVKVLDFGLAKLTATQTGPADSEDATRAEVNTRPGVVMGTVLYMSPEQARGKETDARCDVWSLGVVIYEMLTKQTPFAGETANDSIAAILTREPPPLDDATPSELRRIVRKSLQKQTDERYQTVKDLLLDVKNLKRELEFSEELERSHIPHSTGSSNVSTAQMSENATAIHSGVISTQNSMSQHRSSAEYIVGEIRNHKLAVGAVALLIVLLIGGLFGGYKYFGRSGASTGSPGGANMKVTRVTSTGKATHAAISPDGNYIVHVMADAGKESLWVRQTVTGSNVQILAPADVNYWGITFSRDGNYIYYVTRAVGGGTGFLYRLPVLGGTPVTLVKDVDSPVSLSPDGQQIAFIRWSSRDSGLWLVNADGASEHQLAMLANPETFIGGPSWSPDGAVIVCASISRESGVPHSTVLAVSVANGDKRPMTSQSWGDVGRVAWLGGDSLILIASEQNSTASQLWHLSYPAGQARPITHDLNNYTDVTLTADASTLVTVQTDLQLNVWLAPDGDARRARQLTTGKGPDGFNVSWTPDGKILYDSIVSGNLDIWLTDPVAGNQKQITTDPNFDYGPVASSDGRYIVFESNRLGAYHVWRMNADGSNPTQLTNTDRGESRAAVTPDGRWVVYLSNDAEGITWRMPIDGGDSDQIGDHITTPAISPDGQSMAFWEAFDNQGTSLRRMAVRPLAAGSAARFYDVPQTALFSRNLQWRLDGHAVFFIGSQGGVSNIWVFPLDGSQPKQVTDFQSESIYSFAFSPDGKQLALTRGTSTNDVVLIKDFK